MHDITQGLGYEYCFSTGSGLAYCELHQSYQNILRVIDRHQPRVSTETRDPDCDLIIITEYPEVNDRRFELTCGCSQWANGFLDKDHDRFLMKLHKPRRHF